MREVQVFNMNGDNVAKFKPAKQSSTASLAWAKASNGNDGKLNTYQQTSFESWQRGEYFHFITSFGKSESVGTNNLPLGGWWEVDLVTSTQIRAVRIFNLNSYIGAMARLSNAIVTLYGDNNQMVARVQFGSVNWSQYTIVNKIQCPYAWEQKWTGDVAVLALPVLPTFRVSPLAIGSANRGTADYSPLEDTWTLDGPSGSGRISNTNDNFLFVNTETTGDIDMRLRVKSYNVGSSNNPDSQHCSGLMIRQSLDKGSRHFSILYCGDKRVRRVRRNNVNVRAIGTYDVGGEVHQTDVIEGEVWLRITFSNDNTIRGFTSTQANPSDEDWGDPHVIEQLSSIVKYGNYFAGIGLSRFTFEVSDFTINGARALPNDLTLPSTPTEVEGYTFYNQRMCNNDNQFLDVAGVEDEDGFIAVSSAQACASYCDKTLDCVSVDFLANEYCRLSSSCDHFSSTDPDVRSIWYFKNIAPPSYKKYGESLCTTGSSNLANTNANSVQECANQCSENHECVSFAYPTTNGSTKCRLSSTCVEYSGMSDDSGWDTYAKKDGDDDEDEDICPFLPFAQAEVCCLMPSICVF